MFRFWGWAKQRIHVSWFLSAASTGILTGIALAGQLNIAIFAGMSWLVLSCALFFFPVLKRFRFLIVLALIAGVLIGLWRAAPDQADRLVYDQIIGQEVELKGRVARDVVEGSNSQNLQLSDVEIEGHSLSGHVWASTFARAEIKRSDTVVLSGIISEGFGSFAASMSFARLEQIERAPHADIGRDVRDNFASKIRDYIPETEASLGIGFLTGLRTALPDSLFENLRVLGLVHIVVASGYHLNIVAGTARRHLMKISKYLAVFIPGLIYAAFLLITGFGTSMIRATLVGGMGLAAWYYGRRAHPFVLLPLAAAITALINPGFMWGDMGWYLSFAAFTGVVLLAPLLNAFFFADRGEGKLPRRILLATISAQAFTFPIIAMSFEQYSVYALLANLLVVPVVPFAMLFTFLTGLFGYFAGWLAHILSYPAEWLVKYIIYVSDRLAALPYAEGAINLNMFSVFVSYVLLAALILILKRKTGHDLRGENITY